MVSLSNVDTAKHIITYGYHGSLLCESACVKDKFILLLKYRMTPLWL